MCDPSLSFSMSEQFLDDVCCWLGGRKDIWPVKN